VQPPVPERALERERLPVKTSSGAWPQSRAFGRLEAAEGLDVVTRARVRTDGMREKSIGEHVQLFFHQKQRHTDAVGRVSLLFLGLRSAFLYLFFCSVA